MFFPHRVGDDDKLCNAVMAALLYDLCDAHVVIAQNSGNVGERAGLVRYLNPQENRLTVSSADFTGRFR